MLHEWLSQTAVRWPFYPLIAQSVVLVGIASYLAILTATRRAPTGGVWPLQRAEPTREILTRRWLRFLAGSAPMLGLFGTVVGMTMSFQSLGVESSGSSGLRAGLATQLATTLYGLSIAIPAHALSVLYPWRYQTHV